MNKTLEKRNSLELFIREQTLGPGINGYRYVDLEDQELLSKDLKSEPAINYRTEIVDIVPAAIYSTGILFPEDASETCAAGIALDNNEQNEHNAEIEGSDSQDRSEDDIESSDSIELNQMFPKTMGLTCCVTESCIAEGKFQFNVSARYYKKLKPDKEGKFYNKYALLLDVEREALDRFITVNDLRVFTTRSINANFFLLLCKLTSEEVKVLKTKIKDIQKNLAETLFDKTIRILTLPQLSRQSCYLSNLKSTIYYELKGTVANPSLRQELYEITQEIELIENITDHLINLLDVQSGGYGLWQSCIIESSVSIKNIKFEQGYKKKAYLYNKEQEQEESIVVTDQFGNTSKGLKDLFRFEVDESKENWASLSANVQLTRDTRKDNNKVFVKIQLVNTSSPFDETKQNGNRYYSTFNELVNQKSFFGVKLSVADANLVPYNDQVYSSTDGLFDEDVTTQFIYRQFKDFAVGHGCSVKWSIQGPEVKVETEYLPTCETPDIDPIPRNKHRAAESDHSGSYEAPLFNQKTKAQQFKWLSVFSSANDSDVTNSLLEFVEAYHQWIQLKRGKEEYNSEFRAIAHQELEKCENDYHRMKHNIKVFLCGDDNKDNLLSFRLMNAVMFMQLWHSVKVKENAIASHWEKGETITFDAEFYKNWADDKLFSEQESASWRAFQLAFILLNLDGIFRIKGDSVWERRNGWVDLVWFPTGGGKTEAYLGLIALTIINRRRLFGAEGGGTACLMRYTLRLLTMQQFQRATVMIMALELVRKWGIYNLGDEPITIGLWVGNNSLPNKLIHKDGDRNKDSLLNEFEKLNQDKDNKIPLANCPWCGSKLKGETTVDNSSLYDIGKLHLKCSNTQQCPFSFGKGRISGKRPDQGPIPVCLSDETIYLHPPTLIFGTVDKFAQLAHKVDGGEKGRNKDSRRIFGRGNWEVGKPPRGYLPPDLVIQDELHLLLGPLGSAVALFESAVDQLCTRADGTRPKVISSTATTRNTQLQIAALFDRKVNLFPKPGVECDDSFFAFYRRKYNNSAKDGEVYLSKRKYAGFLPTGKTQIWMQMRLAAILMTHRAVFELRELGGNASINFEAYGSVSKAMDYYHTLISYFNSLKEVGKTQSQIQSYILKELRRVFSRVVRPQKLMHAIYTYGPIREAELTGRLSGEEVKNELKSIETKWDAQARFAHLVDESVSGGKTPPEFIVATNMISVGIDVSRFNTIIMNSMPRNIAEYIQASSRVARNDYGIVLTVHHPFRARDVSHYEKFVEFHEKMYSYVEPISITPFTKKAIERYLGLYLATMIRHRFDFEERESAAEISNMTNDDLLALVGSISDYFANRRSAMSHFDLQIKSLLKEENVEDIREWIREAVLEWQAESGKTLAENKRFVFNNKAVRAEVSQEQLYVDIEEYEGNIHSKKWQIPMSLRVIEPEAAIKIHSY